MAKSFPWSTIVPSGSEQAMTADDHFRRLRLEIGERMGDIVVDWAADPVQLKPSMGQVGKVLTIHSSEFVIEPSEDETVEYGESGVTISQAANPIRAPVHLPLGATVRRMQWLVTNGDTAPLVMKLGSIAFAVGAASTSISSMSTTDSGAQIVDSNSLSPFSHVVNSDEILFLAIDKGSGAQFVLHGVRLTYDAPDARNTI